MAAPRRYNDFGLFLVMAELLAWPEHSGVTSKCEAIEAAIRLNPLSDRWSPVEAGRTRERLKRNYGKYREKLERLSRAKGRYEKPLSPTLLGSTHLDPEISYLEEAYTHRRLTATLRTGSKWLLDLVDILEEQFARGETNPALLKHSREIAALLDAEARAHGEPPMAEWIVGVKRPI